MKATRFWTRSGVVLSLAGAAMLSLALPAGAQSTTPTTPPSTTKSATPSTAPSTAPMTAPRKGDDDAAEFAKLDKNHDGGLDKAEAIMEPRLFAKFSDADTNKDGKIDQQEFLNFYKNNPRASAK
ncbi:MAG TPA: EF-hand domain-containing protein [Casimicrobiaceae bacterium]